MFTASLEQTEEYADAARSVSAVTKPVLLYYAVNAAGRAILADQVPAGTTQYPGQPNWVARGHGLRAKTDGSLFEWSAKKDSRGLFPRVADVLGSSLPEGRVSVGALWRSLPELPSLEFAHPDDYLRRSSDLFPFPIEAAGADPSRGPDSLEIYQPTRARLRVDGDTNPLDEYPDARGWRYETSPTSHGGLTPTAIVSWPGQGTLRGKRSLLEVAVHPDPAKQLTGPFEAGEPFFIRPPIEPGTTNPSRLMTWWALLLVLSQAARYEPSLWRKALDVDQSRLAVTVEEALETAERVLPVLLWEALFWVPSWREHGLPLHP